MATKKAATPRPKRATKEAAPPPTNRFRDRITGMKKVKASQLRAHPKNWRIHNAAQRMALEGIMAEIGFAGAIMTYNDEKGLVIIDGHLRADLANDDTVTVLTTDLTEDEAQKALATFDAIGTMAIPDLFALETLLEPLEFDSHDAEAAIRNIFDADVANLTKREKIKRSQEHNAAGEIPAMELEPQEHYDYVMIVARTRTDWHRLCSTLELSHVRKSQSRSVGLCRVVDVRKFLDIIDAKPLV